MAKNHKTVILDLRHRLGTPSVVFAPTLYGPVQVIYSHNYSSDKFPTVFLNLSNNIFKSSILSFCTLFGLSCIFEPPAQECKICKRNYKNCDFDRQFMSFYWYSVHSVGGWGNYSEKLMSKFFNVRLVQIHSQKLLNKLGYTWIKQASHEVGTKLKIKLRQTWIRLGPLP